MKLSPPAAAMLALPADACLWPRGRGWCGKPAEPGRAYCARHHRRSVDPKAVVPSPRTIASILGLRPRA